MTRSVLVCSLVLAMTSVACTAGSQQAPEHVVGGRTAEDVFTNPKVAALARAACAGDATAVRDALSSGARVDGADAQQITPLMWAETCSSAVGVEALLQAGANPNALVTMDEGGTFTPVLIASKNPDSAILRLVLKYGGDPNAFARRSTDSALMNALTIGIDGSGWTNFEMLLDAGADPNRSHSGETVAERAVILRQHDRVLELLNRGYRYKIARLGYFASTERANTLDTEQLRARDRLISELERLGVQFPVDESVAHQTAEDSP